MDPRVEFARSRLGDARLEARLQQIVAALVNAPERSFPDAMQTDAALEAAYRFFQNARVTLDRLLEPHLEATAARARLHGDVLAVHDTSEFRYEGLKRRVGLGEIAGNGQGFFGHFALLVTERTRLPLGLGGVLAYTRKSHRRSRVGMTETQRIATPGESDRWDDLVAEVEQRIGDVRPIHVMDREADDFHRFETMTHAGLRFVIRLNAARRRKASTSDTNGVHRLETLIASAPIVATREVMLSARGGKRGWKDERTHPVRDRRLATLSISAATIDVRAPRSGRKRAPLPLSVVRVVEINTPAGEGPVEWVLYSSEPVTTKAEVLRIVDVYRARWTIEEYFKVLKTGCAIERRQLESLHSLLAALGVFAPLAVRMLALRNYARDEPTGSAAVVLSDIELRALRTICRPPLPSRPNVRDALFAIAALGGHLKNNGDPGWITIARGFEKLDVAARVIAAIAGDPPRCDQS